VVKESQGKFLDAQFKMSAAAEKLGQLIQGATVDEAKVREQVDQVLTLEREVKRAQISLLVRIKNQLTVEQQAQLVKLRKQDWTRPPEP
jgi:Spy/CpxP family protein refolding chaperone